MVFVKNVYFKFINNTLLLLELKISRVEFQTIKRVRFGQHARGRGADERAAAPGDGQGVGVLQHGERRPDGAARALRGVKAERNVFRRYALLKAIVKEVIQLDAQYWLLLDVPKQDKQEQVSLRPFYSAQSLLSDSTVEVCA
ncbi:hypothetical protein CEXT_577421 [Caerostris extrusa]|uniref:Uncharacterized protein n=1 Tax=Caerostris extrusa TaxID=172846 RepID=A0AAV4RHX9_CAEEX|nr:hypothetical protein CEXT_577421 [Caerostris extrusa]